MSTVSSAGLAQYNTKPVTNRQNRQADRIATAISLYMCKLINVAAR